MIPGATVLAVHQPSGSTYEAVTQADGRFVMPGMRVGGPYTVDELDRMPSDGHRYELVDGVLVVSPRPTTVHQFVAMRLLRVLADAWPEDLCAVPEPAVELGPQTEFDPDLVVVRMDQIGGAKFTEPPLLVVEISSPDDRFYDTLQKLEEYRAWGVKHVWLVDPYSHRMYTSTAGLLTEVPTLRVPEIGVELTPGDIFE